MNTLESSLAVFPDHANETESQFVRTQEKKMEDCNFRKTRDFLPLSVTVNNCAAPITRYESSWEIILEGVHAIHTRSALMKRAVKTGLCAMMGCAMS